MTSVSAAAFTQPLQSHMKGKGTSENGPYTMCIACVSYVVDSVRSQSNYLTEQMVNGKGPDNAIFAQTSQNKPLQGMAPT